MQDQADEACRQVQPVVEQPVSKRGEHGCATAHADQGECPGEACLDHAEPAWGERDLPEKRYGRVGHEHQRDVRVRADGCQCAWPPLRSG